MNVDESPRSTPVFEPPLSAPKHLVKRAAPAEDLGKTGRPVKQHKRTEDASSHNDRLQFFEDREGNPAAAVFDMQTNGHAAPDHLNHFSSTAPTVPLTRPANGYPEFDPHSKPRIWTSHGEARSRDKKEYYTMNTERHNDMPGSHNFDRFAVQEVSRRSHQEDEDMKDAPAGVSFFEIDEDTASAPDEESSTCTTDGYGNRQPPGNVQTNGMSRLHSGLNDGNKKPLRNLPLVSDDGSDNGTTVEDNFRALKKSEPTAPYHSIRESLGNPRAKEMMELASRGNRGLDASSGTPLTRAGPTIGVSSQSQKRKTGHRERDDWGPSRISYLGKEAQRIRAMNKLDEQQDKIKRVVEGAAEAQLKDQEIKRQKDTIKQDRRVEVTFSVGDNVNKKTEHVKPPQEGHPALSGPSRSAARVKDRATASKLGGITDGPEAQLDAEQEKEQRAKANQARKAAERAKAAAAKIAEKEQARKDKARQEEEQRRREELENKEFVEELLRQKAAERADHERQKHAVEVAKFERMRWQQSGYHAHEEPRRSQGSQKTSDVEAWREDAANKAQLSTGIDRAEEIAWHDMNVAMETDAAQIQMDETLVQNSDLQAGHSKEKEGSSVAGLLVTASSSAPQTHMDRRPFQDSVRKDERRQEQEGSSDSGLFVSANGSASPSVIRPLSSQGASPLPSLHDSTAGGPCSCTSRHRPCAKHRTDGQCPCRPSRPCKLHRDAAASANPRNQVEGMLDVG